MSIPSIDNLGVKDKIFNGEELADASPLLSE